ncbi:Chloroperoxidase [Mycena amicta]|nr:Chloroperoxidase [Mycena amicta]
MKQPLVLLGLFAVLAQATAARRESLTTEVQDGQTGTLIAIPPQPTETGSKRIPDPAHPFIAPGPDAQRGPCPAMNTLANHGYIPRNGIATFEEITLGVMEAFNIEPNMAANMVATNMLTRGNPFVNKISIGGVSPLVPPLPGKIDGAETKGIAQHGRVEGDASMTRADAFIGDNRNFQNILYDLDLLQLGKFGDNGVDGNSTVFNVQTLIGINSKTSRWTKLRIRSIFANGTTKEATLPIVGSFFRNQTFPQNWFRAASPVTGSIVAVTANAIRAAVPLVPGGKNADGIYVADPAPPPPFNTSLGCEAYYSQLSVIPGAFQNTTGIFKANVDLLTGILFRSASGNPGCNQQVLPFGPPDL